MSTEPNKPTPILIELAPRPGVQRVALPKPEELARLSAQALENAWTTVHAMAERASAMIEGLSGDPDEVQLEFGVKMDVEGNAMVAKAGAEGAISVSLTWKREGAK
jgi:hypothetical protein